MDDRPSRDELHLARGGGRRQEASLSEARTAHALTDALTLALDPGRLSALQGLRILDTAEEARFEDAVRLAARLCAVPVALVSLVDADRQWFKARVGFPPCETDLERSVCKFALSEPDLLIIPDLTLDPRTAANPLVTADPNIRFYAGAPLRLAGGQVVGSLCVIDTAPRPQGLTPEQADDLRALGRQVSDLLELRRDVMERQAAQEALRTSEGQLRLVIESAKDHAILTTDAGGVIESWSAGAEAAFGWSPDEVLGQSAAILFTDEDRAAGVPRRELSTARVDGCSSDERWHVTKTGERVFMNGAVHPLPRHANGAERGFIKVARNETERRRVAERLRESEAEVRASEEHWRGLFERLSEGLLIGEVIRDADRRIVDWRYVDVNRAWGELVGIDPASVAGRTIREVFPGIEDAWVDEFAAVVRTGQPITFTRQLRSLRRWYEGRAFPLGGDQFGVLFLEVTGRVEGEARRDGLIAFGDRLREGLEAGEVTRVGSEIIGGTLGAKRVGYGTVADDGERFEVEEDWTTPGFPTLAGRYTISDYGLYAEDLRRGRTVVIPDVQTDERTMATAATLRDVGVRSLINLPVVERGRTVAILYVNDDEVRTWSDEDVAFVRQVAELTRQAVERARAEDQQDILNQELSHRLKNSFAMVLSIAGQTLRSVPDRGPVEAFEQRIHALSSAHDVLLQKSWAAASATEVVRSVLSDAGHGDRFEVTGPNLDLGPRATLSLALLLHELTTNAAKYGALSTPEGRVNITWRIGEGEQGREAVFEWSESGGPPVAAPTSTGRRGFGSRLIRAGLVGTGGVDLDYRPAGLLASMRAPLDQLQSS